MMSPENPFADYFKKSNTPETIEKLRNPNFMLTAPIEENIADRMQEWLGYWGVENPTRELSIFIATIGGNLSDSLRVADSMMISPNPIKTIACGECYSGGTLAVAAGSRGNRWAYPNADFLIHGIQLSGEADGSLVEQSNEIEHYERLNEMTMRFLAKLTGQPVRILRRDMKKNTYMNAKEAAKYGLIDHIVSYTKPLAKILPLKK